MRQLQRFDLSIPADNGLHRGTTTGTCAAAAVKAAVLLLESGVKVSEIGVSLPDGLHFVNVPIENVVVNEDDTVTARVIKRAGDDPDNTNGVAIWARVQRNETGQMRFLAGDGVGLVTNPGIRVPVGEPAINPAPRQMMRTAIEEVLEGSKQQGYDITVGCENGKEIARRTFNPRLGIVGGISIIGTTGIVEPMSLSAYKAAIEVYIRVALADGASRIALLPGNIGTGYASQTLELSRKQIVQISNFLGFSLAYVDEFLSEMQAELPELYVLGHPGKLAKVLDDVWETHSGKSGMAMGAIARVAKDCGFDPQTVEIINNSTSVEAALQHLGAHPESIALWSLVELRVAKRVQEKTKRVSRVEVRLFGMTGQSLGQGVNEESVKGGGV